MAVCGLDSARQPKGALWAADEQTPASVAQGGVVTSPWDAAGAGVLRLPSERLVRGRGLRMPLPSGPRPTFGVYLLSTPPAAVAWEARWIRWPDFWLPGDREHARRVLHEAWACALTERVEIACTGGHGRTGTALACLAVIDGLPPQRAVALIRQHYDPRAIETPGRNATSAISGRRRKTTDAGRQIRLLSVGHCPALAA